MTITYSQVIKLLSAVAIAVPDELDCDGCYQLIGELADAEIQSLDLSASLHSGFQACLSILYSLICGTIIVCDCVCHFFNSNKLVKFKKFLFTFD